MLLRLNMLNDTQKGHDLFFTPKLERAYKTKKLKKFEVLSSSNKTDNTNI